MHYCADFSKEKVVGVISVLVLNPEHWFKSMETWPTQDRYTEQHSLRRSDEGGVLKSVSEGWGRSGQCCLRARLTERQRRGVEERRWTAALHLWNGGVCGSAMQRGAAPLSHKSVTSKPHHYHILWHADNPASHGQEKQEQGGGRFWESLVPQFFVPSLVANTQLLVTGVE